MCDADLAAESVPSDLLTRPLLPTRWAKVLCVILVINAIFTMIIGYRILDRETVYYLEKYGAAGIGIESLENFIGFGYYVFGLFTAIAVYGILKTKKAGPRFLYIMHGIAISSYIMYLLNIYELLSSVDGLKISILIPVQLMFHLILLPVNYLYFRKRKNVYDDVF